MEKPLEVIIPPVRTWVDGAIVEILEVIPIQHPSKKVTYHVTCRVRWRGITTRPFFIDVEDIKDFEKKISVEISKLKMMYLVRGKEFVEGIVR